MNVHEEYLTSEYHRLNLQVARAIGANAAIDRALDRVCNVKSTPRWMIEFLENAAERLPGLSADLAAYRDQCHDAERWKPKPQKTS